MRFFRRLDDSMAQNMYSIFCMTGNESLLFHNIAVDDEDDGADCGHLLSERRKEFFFLPSGGWFAS